MDQFISMLTVLFQEPFWIGIYEREGKGKYEVSKIIFGAEPTNNEVYDFMSKNFSKLRFSPSIAGKGIDERRINPKRMQREIKKQVQEKGIGTKAQLALKYQQEQGKLERKAYSRKKKEAEKELQFELKQKKRKEKHKGH